MSELDLNNLISKLDPDCLGYLEKASQFCLQQQQPEVSIEHLLLQMLDDACNPLNRLLEYYALSPVAWIRKLLSNLSERKPVNHGKPVFSRDLLNWLSLAVERINRNPEGRVTPRDLIESLLGSTTLKHRLNIDDLKRLDSQQVDDFFLYSSGDEPDTDIASEPDMDITPGNDEGTVIMSSEEIDDSTRAAVSAAPQKIPEIPGYGSLRQIGEGGMAVVYLASHLGLDREVALKVLTATGGDDFVERFLREARIVARLNHPNIIQIYDVNRSQDLTYLAMEYVSGGELAERMPQGFTLQQTVDLLTQVLSALNFAHNEGFVHRDIKPSNILFRDNGSVALTDFGIARALGEDSGLTLAGSIVGTPRYMSPEQAQGNRVDHRSDLYSVAVLFFEMLEGRLPYVGDSALGTAMKHIIEPIPELSEQWLGCQDFLNRGMAKEMDARFQSGQEMIEALHQLRQA